MRLWSVVEGQGPFEILEISATGAYGAVAVARYLDDGGRVVAVKALKSDYLNRPKILARARDEARMLFKLRHPNIVRVERLLDVGGRPVLLMEWVEGVSFRQLLNRYEKVPVAVALEMVRLIALALDAAYNTVNADGSRMCIIHRDIKPSNLLLSLSGEVKVVDFGVATGDFDDRETSTVSTIMGTQGYMAPERLDGVADSPAIDVYALGVTLFEMLTSRSPLLPSAPKNHQDQLSRSLDRLLDLDIPPGLDGPEPIAELISKMCTYSYERRPSVAEIQMELSAMLIAFDNLPDLTGYALQSAVPIYNSRPEVPPKQHGDYAELAFLERPWTSAEILPRDNAEAVPTTVVQEDSPADKRVRSFLAEDGWVERRKELTWLLATNSGWTEGPFLEVLDRSDEPWWKIWARRPSTEELKTALIMLRYRRNKRVVARVESFRDHSNQGVASAARALIENA